MSTRLASEIQSAWKLRGNQEIESCFRKTSELCTRLGLTGYKLDFEKLQKLITNNVSQCSDIEQVVLLQASLLRARGQYKESREQIAIIEKVLDDALIAKSSRLHFERGI